MSFYRNVFLLKVDKWLRFLNPIYLILLAFFLMLLTSFLVTTFFEIKPDLNVDKHWLYQLILAVILAPFLETLLFQKIPIDLGSFFQIKIFNRVYPIFNVLLSSFVFALIHPYSIGYFVFTFLFGLIFSYVYVVRSNYTYFSSFTTVCILHFFWNLLVFIGRQLN